jgi:integrase/recombinase XerD
LARFCILAGPTRGRGWSPTAARSELRELAAQAGVPRRFAPHQYADLLFMPTSL